LSTWLESKGYYSLITHERKEIGIWIGDLFPSKMYIEPDVVGVRSSWTDTVCIEAKARLESGTLFEILGKCKMWKLIADKVYFAYPKPLGTRTSGFQELNIGLLEVSNNHVREVFAPRIEGIRINSKSQELFNQVWNVIRSQSRGSEIQITEVSTYRYEDKWNLTIRFRNTGSNELMLTELLIDGKPCQEVPDVKLTSKFPSREKPLLIAPFKEDYVEIQIMRRELFKSGSQVEFCIRTQEGRREIRKIELAD